MVHSCSSNDGEQHTEVAQDVSELNTENNIESVIKNSTCIDW